ncbi:O-antigen/teichoic acid export membrane protein [Lysobacter niabensis]|uniref:O-antigen/teichoic acid export membrane protein n=1 Tax=Agrilutibacter niabensis TaxID=380628 RepID=A0ABU1VJT9_9GAMM|nr:O-antigen/teichoic acid export membrane protein [Lysobacter niabensis]
MLARLLAPSDFGLIAMLSLFIGLASVLMDGGFSAALIQRREIDEADKSTVFWFNLCTGGLLTLALFAAAPIIARIFDRPALVPLTRAMAFLCLLSSTGAIHSTLLIRDLNFRTQAKAGAIAALVSAGVAIILASRGYGVWALVAQALLMAAALSALLWALNPWRPSLTFNLASLRKLLGFGGYHLGSSLLEMAYSRLYTLFVGRSFGASELGYYANADNTRMIPGNFLAGVISRVALPMFSAAAQEPLTLRRGMQLSIRGMMLINAPVMLGLAVLAEPVITVLFGRQWLPAVPIFRVLCLAGVLYPLNAINLHALMAQGHAGLMFRLEVTKKMLGIAFLVVGAWYGVMGVAWSQVAFSIVALCINAHYSAKLLDFGAFSQFREFAPSTIAAALVAVGVQTVCWVWMATPFMKLVVLGGAGALVYLAVISLARLDALEDVAALFWRARLSRQDK